MSNIYIQEPPTHGKVLLHTSVGDVEVELWSKEAPLACRNFVQLCMEGYYDGVLFHRIVPGFIAQTGDPTGTGTGGESIYGSPFKDEFHQRLRFNRRGLVAMANAGTNDNGSQFFFTLDRCDELNRKHTIFGRVVGNTIFNVIRLGELPLEGERPVDPCPRILGADVLHNPFPDIVPRAKPVAAAGAKASEKREREERERQAVGRTRNFSLLSFGVEAEEEDADAQRAVQAMGKVKSSHDVVNDPGLSREVAIDIAAPEPDDAGPPPDRPEKAKEAEEEVQRSSSRAEALRQEARALKRRLQQRESEREQASHEPASWPHDAGKYVRNRDRAGEQRDKRASEARALAALEAFRGKLSHAVAPASEQGGAESGEVESLLARTGDALDSEAGDLSWMQQQLKFTSSASRAVRDANVPKTDEQYELDDPSNPLVKRRRAHRSHRSRHAAGSNE